MFGLSLNSRQEGRWEPGDPLRLCELSGRVPPEFSLHWRGLCSVMLLSQQRPATACFLVSASGPDDSALESKSIPSSFGLLPPSRTLCAVMLAFVTSKAGIIGSSTRFQQSCSDVRRSNPTYLGLPLIVGWENGQHRFGEGKAPWGHLASYQTSDQTHLVSCLSA